MRILILANIDAGLYKFRKELLAELVKENEVFFCVPNGDYIEALEAMGCKHIPFAFNRRGTNPIADLGQIKRYIKLLKEQKPDVVLTYTIKPNVYGGLACRIAKVPYITNVTGLGTSMENGGLLNFISTTLYKIGIKKARCVFFQNEANQKRFLEMKLTKGKTKLIPGSGVNLQAHYFEPYPDVQEGIRFLFVGRIMRDKGIGELLEAMRQVHKENTNVTLDIVGGCDEDYSAALKAAEQEGIIRYHGAQPDVHPFYAGCHCVVLPSYHEGMANVLLEAASTGRPVIATRVPGCRETFDEGITGLGCEVKDAQSLADAMNRFIALSHEEKAAMGCAGRQKMEKEFNRQIVIDAYLEELKKIAEV